MRPLYYLIRSFVGFRVVVYCLNAKLGITSGSVYSYSFYAGL